MFDQTDKELKLGQIVHMSHYGMIAGVITGIREKSTLAGPQAIPAEIVVEVVMRKASADGKHIFGVYIVKEPEGQLEEEKSKLLVM